MLAFLGYAPVERKLSVRHPLQVYVSCHGEDLAVEKEKLAGALDHPVLAFNVAIGEAAFPPAEIEAGVRRSDYLVLIQGRRWLAVRRLEHRAAVEGPDCVTGLYFQRRERSPQPGVVQFQEEVGPDCWQFFMTADELADQALTGLWETLGRQARAGQAVSLRSLTGLFLVTQLLRGGESSLPALLDRLTAGDESPGRIRAVDEAKEPASQEQRLIKRSADEPELVLIPAGRFWMGTERLDLEMAGVEWQDWMKRETPSHQLSLPAYAIGRYPVTNAEYARFIEDGGYRQKAFWTAAGRFCRRRKT